MYQIVMHSNKVAKNQRYELIGLSRSMQNFSSNNSNKLTQHHSTLALNITVTIWTANKKSTAQNVPCSNATGSSYKNIKHGVMLQ